jgi:cytochrome P450
VSDTSLRSSTSSTLPVLPLGDPTFWQDINTPLREAREASPLAFTDDGALYVLRADEIEQVLKDNHFLAADLLALMGMGSGPVWEWWQRLMFSNDPPNHTRLRSLVGRAFTARSSEAHRARIRAIAEELLAPAREAGGLEVMAELAHLLPSWVMCDMLGIPEEDRDVFTDWTTDIGLAFSAALDPDVRTRVEAALAHLQDYVSALIDRRRAAPGDDLLSTLIAVEDGGDKLSRQELIDLVENLMFAGHDTTRSAVGITAMLFATHPDQLDVVRSHPAAIPNAVEEILRYEAVTFSTARLASVDTEIAGYPIEAGTTVGVCLPAASRDPRRYQDPDRFDVSRVDVRPPTFGAGAHFCLGAALARTELQETVAALIDGVDAIELEEPAQWLPFAYIRRFERLPIRLVRR